MFKKLREPWKPGRAKGIFTGVIFGLICLTFVFVGLTPGENGTNSGIGAAATVNDVVISVADFQERVAMVENQYGDAFKNLPAAQRQMSGKRLRASALDELVGYELVYQSAERVGVLPTDAGTRDLITSIPAFQEEGRFTRQKYDQYLNYKGIVAADFESKVKRDVVVGQIRELFFTALRPPTIARDLSQIVQDTKLNIEFIKIDEKPPESVSSVEVRARHILIKGDNEASLKKINEIRKEAEKADFAGLATKYSEDEGTKSKGGDLGFFSKGKMVPQFEESAFALPVGKISDPVKTNYGYHLIKVEEHRGRDNSGEPSEKAIAKRQLELSELLKNKKDISGWVSKYKMKWEETGEFSLSQNKLPKIEAGEDALMAAVHLKTKGEIYPELLRTGSVSYILKLKNKISAPPQNTSDSKIGGAAAGTSYSADGAETFGLWAEELKKSALISRNEALLN